MIYDTKASRQSVRCNVIRSRSDVSFIISYRVVCASEVLCRTKSVYLCKVYIIKDMSPEVLYKTIMPPHFGVKEQCTEW